MEQQGLLRNAHFGRGKNATLRTIEHLGYVQIDTISVVQRAHHHVLMTRVPNYQPRFLERLQTEGKVFEYWYHAAAYLPMRDYRFALPRMRAMKSRLKEGGAGWVRSRDSQLMTEILDRIRSDGRLRSRDFEDTRDSNAGWWDWKPAKRALEQLFIQGDLMITGRDGFQKLAPYQLIVSFEIIKPKAFPLEIVARLDHVHLHRHWSLNFPYQFGVEAELKNRAAFGILTELGVDNLV